MRLAPLLMALGLGAAGGAVAWWATRPPALTLAQVEAGRCEEDRRDVRGRADVLRREVERVRGEVAALRRARAARLGARLPWPESVEPELQPEAVRAHLDEALRGTRARLVNLDCSAYPCVAVLATSHDPTIDFQFVRAPVEGEANMPGDLLAKLREDPYDSLPLLETGRLAGAEDVDDPTLHAVLFFSPSDLAASERPEDPALAAQDGTRLDQIHGRLVQQVTEWEARSWR